MVVGIIPYWNAHEKQVYYGNKIPDFMKGDQKMIRRARSFTTFFRGILIGWIAGAAVALVSAPRRGDETRAVIRDKSLELKDQAVEKVEQTRTKAEELARVSAERVNELKYQGQATLQEQKVTLQSTLEGVKEGVKTYKEEGEGSQADVGPVETGL